MQGMEKVVAVIHHKIRDIRKRRGLTMQELAAAVGTSQQQIDRLEKGHRRLTLEWLERLSQALGCSVVELLPPSFQRDSVERTAKAKVIGEVSADGIIHWWPEDERYTLVFGRPEHLTNARFFAIRIGSGGEAIGFSPGTELVFSEVESEAQNTCGSGMVICAQADRNDTIYCVEKSPSSRDVRAIRARLVKSLRNE